MRDLNTDAEMEHLSHLIKNHETLYNQGIQNNKPFDELKRIWYKLKELKLQLAQYEKTHAPRKKYSPPK